MPPFSLNDYQIIDSNQIEHGIFLWISHADKIPPHIGISLDGNYFSLKVSGKDDTTYEKILRTIHLNKVPSVVLKLNETSFEDNRFTSIKSEYTSINQEIKTCLIPILDLFKIKEKPFLLHDFLTYLQDKNQIIGYFSLNLPANFTGIKKYSLEDVTMHLNKLKHAERSKHIS